MVQAEVGNSGSEFPENRAAEKRNSWKLSPSQYLEFLSEKKRLTTPKGDSFGLDSLPVQVSANTLQWVLTVVLFSMTS